MRRYRTPTIHHRTHSNRAVEQVFESPSQLLWSVTQLTTKNLQHGAHQGHVRAGRKDLPYRSRGRRAWDTPEYNNQPPARGNANTRWVQAWLVVGAPIHKGAFP
jgi:hypothetical protein